MNKRKVLNWTISIIILVILLIKIPLNEIKEVFFTINIEYILLAILIGLVFMLIGGFNIYILLKAINYKASVKKIIQAYLKSWSLGLIGLGKTGELTIIYFLRDKRNQIGEITAITIIDKLITFVTLLGLGVIGAFILVDTTTGLIFLALGVGVAVVCLVAFTEKIRKIIRKYFLRKYEDKLTGFSKTIKQLLKEKNAIIINTILTLVRWYLSALITWTLFIPLNYNITVWQILMIDAVVTLIAMIPISINGLGVKESGAVYLYSLLGLGAAGVLTAYLIKRVINIILAIICSLTMWHEK